VPVAALLASLSIFARLHRRAYVCDPSTKHVNFQRSGREPETTARLVWPKMHSEFNPACSFLNYRLNAPVWAFCAVAGVRKQIFPEFSFLLCSFLCRLGNFALLTWGPVDTTVL
jgi:hypothetical protein